MGYLKCDKCGGYYELQEGESPNDFSDKCECGGNLEYVETLSTTKPQDEKSLSYMCVDIRCKFAEQEDMEGHCPECGKQLHEVNSKEALRIADHKKRYSNNPKNVQSKKIPIKKPIKKDEKEKKGHIALGLCCFGVILIIVVGGLLLQNNTSYATYNGSVMSFQYPSGWNVSTSGNSVKIYKDDDNWFVVNYLEDSTPYAAELVALSDQVDSGNLKDDGYFKENTTGTTYKVFVSNGNTNNGRMNTIYIFLKNGKGYEINGVIDDVSNYDKVVATIN